MIRKGAGVDCLNEEVSYIMPGKDLHVLCAVDYIIITAHARVRCLCHVEPLILVSNILTNVDI